MGAVKSRIWSPHWTESREVKIHTGKIRGRRYHFPLKGDVDAFLGIPFAKAPVNDLRFKVTFYQVITKQIFIFRNLFLLSHGMVSETVRSLGLGVPMMK